MSLLQHSLSQMRMSGYEEIVTFGAGATLSSKLKEDLDV